MRSKWRVNILCSLVFLLTPSIGPCWAQGVNLIPTAQSEWHRWSPRSAIAPQQSIDGEGDRLMLHAQAKAFSQYGEWYASVPSIHPGKFYRFDASYSPRDISNEIMSIAAILTWCGADCGASAVQRDYVTGRNEIAADLRHMSRTVKAPQGAESLKVELILRWTGAGAVVWRDIQLREADPPKPRIVRVATTHVTPPIPSTLENNLRLMGAILDKAGEAKADVVCLSENVIGRGIDLPLNKRAQKLAAPVMELVSQKAKQYQMYVATAIEEPDGPFVYNTALLFNREGKVALKYRKVHLPLSEAEMGYTPGSEYRVVDTDFGRIGVLICWDYWFPEPARILRLKGAELMLLPLAGDGGDHWDAVTKTRAMENGMYLAASGLVPSSSSRIVSPEGKVLAESAGDFSLVTADIDLNQEFRSNWLSVGPGLGEGKTLYMEERRPETYTPLDSRSRSVDFSKR